MFRLPLSTIFTWQVRASVKEVPFHAEELTS
jgi:hypothetical protein